MSLIKKFDKSATSYLTGAREHLQKSLNQAANAAHSSIEVVKNIANAGQSFFLKAAPSALMGTWNLGKSFLNLISFDRSSAKARFEEAKQNFADAKTAVTEGVDAGKAMFNSTKSSCTQTKASICDGLETGALVAAAIAAGFTESVNAISEATVAAAQTVSDVSHYFLPAHHSYKEKMSAVELSEMKPIAMEEIVVEVPQVRAAAAA